MTYHALIVGGGPAGATAALLLARAGWSVAVIEQKAFPRRKVCGEFISATTMPLLRRLGVHAAFDKRAGPRISRVGLFAGDTILAARMPGAEPAEEPWGRALGREHLDLMLLEAAARAGAMVWQPWRVAELRRDGDVTVCGIVNRTGRTSLKAQTVILAYGSWQRRAPLGAAAGARRATDLLAFKAHFRRGELATDLMPLIVFPGGYGGMVRSDDGRLSLSCCIRRDTLERCREHHPGTPAGEAVLRHIAFSCRGVREALSGASRDGPWLSAGPIRPGIRPRYANGMFRVGNLAGEAHPIIAEGISMAMQSSWLLAAELIARADEAMTARGRDAIGRNYASAWSSAFATRLHAAALFAAAAVRPAAAELWVPLARRWPAVLTFGAQLSGKSRLLVA